MKNTKKILYILMFSFIFILIGTVKSNAGNLKLNNLNFYAQINNDGSMDVMEIWDIYISETNTLYKSFKTDSKKYSGITNVTVKEITNELAGDLQELKFFSISRPVDVTGLIDSLRETLNDSDKQKQKNLLKQNIKETVRLTVTGDVVERQNFITISTKNTDIAEKELQKQAMDLSNKFSNCGIKTEILNEQELIQLCNSTLNINFAFKEDNDEVEDRIPYLKIE